MSQAHWDGLWTDRAPDDVSWFQAEPTESLALIRSVTDRDASILDIGGGASRLVDVLLRAGYTDLTVLDLAAGALAQCQERLGERAQHVDWVVGDVTTHEFGRTFDLWHDRAVLHFLVAPEDRNRYAGAVRRSVAPGGHAVIATFSPSGPKGCSGLPVQRYDESAMIDFLGDGFEGIEFVESHHVTPAGASQDFLYGLFRRLP
ncbi:MAG: class I SAM-dependent methyltransferase [Microthrixaceae bacterium]